MSNAAPEQLTEQELATAFEHTFGMASSMAAELAASHRGKLPPDAEKIPTPAGFDPVTFWRP